MVVSERPTGRVLRPGAHRVIPRDRVWLIRQGTLSVKLGGAPAGLYKCPGLQLSELPWW